MRLLLDTHAFIWLVEDDERLTARARAAIADPNTNVFLSVASVREMAIKVGNKKLALSEALTSFVNKWTALYMVEPLPVLVRHALRVEGLPHNHRDPFDRITIAQAIEDDMAIASADRHFEAYSAPIVW